MPENNNKRPNEEYVDQVLTSLKIIAMIKEGQKVCVRNGLLSLENSSTGIRVAIRRWVDNDNRQSTLVYIRNVVNNAMDIAYIHPDYDVIDKLRMYLIGCITGLGSLAVTYGTDASITASIEVLQERIKTHIKQGHLD